MVRHLRDIILAIVEIAEHDALGAVQHARLHELRQAPVQPIPRLADVFEEEQLAGRTRLVWRAAQGREHGKIAADEFGRDWLGRR